MRIPIDLPSLLPGASACRGTRAVKAAWKVQRLTCIDISGAGDSRISRIATRYTLQLIYSGMAPSRALVRSRSWVRYSCPLAEKCDCHRVFSHRRHAMNHAKSVHQGIKLYLCPLAEQYSCNETFSRRSSATNHARLIHQRIKKPYPCPLAEQYNCIKTWPKRYLARNHAKSAHQRITFPCLLAEEYGCDKTFSRRSYATNHARSVHQGIRPYPCPLAKMYDCDKAFFQKQHATIHGTSVHQGIKPYPCPLAGKYNCTTTFNSNYNAQQHAHSVHQGGTYLCPLVAEYDCTKTFSWKENATKHAKTAHLGINRWMCSVPRCTHAVRQQTLSSRRMSRHMAKHQTWGHLFGENDHLPIAVQDLALPDAVIAEGADSDEEADGADEDPNWGAGEGDEHSDEWLPLEQRNEMIEQSKGYLSCETII